MKIRSVIAFCLFLLLLGSLAFSAPQLVFLREDEEGGVDAWVADLDGANQRQITSSGEVSDVKFLTRDIVVVASQGQIWSINLKTGAKEKLFSLAKIHYWIENLACDPEGKFIIFSAAPTNLVFSEELPSFDLFYGEIKTGKTKVIVKEVFLEGDPPEIAIWKSKIFYTDWENLEPSAVKIFDLMTNQSQTFLKVNRGIENLRIAKNSDKLLVVTYLNLPEEREIKFIVFDLTEKGRDFSSFFRRLRFGEFDPIIWITTCWLPGEKEFLVGFQFPAGEKPNFIGQILDTAGRRIKKFLTNAFAPDIWY